MRKNVKKVVDFIIQIIYALGTIIFYNTLFNVAVIYYVDYGISSGYFEGFTKFKSILFSLQIGFSMIIVYLFAIIKAIKDTQNLKNN